MDTSSSACACIYELWWLLYWQLWICLFLELRWSKQRLFRARIRCLCLYILFYQMALYLHSEFVIRICACIFGCKDLLTCGRIIGMNSAAFPPILFHLDVRTSTVNATNTIASLAIVLVNIVVGRMRRTIISCQYTYEALIGLSKGRMISCPGVKLGWWFISFKFSLWVFPECCSLLAAARWSDITFIITCNQ